MGGVIMTDVEFMYCLRSGFAYEEYSLRWRLICTDCSSHLFVAALLIYISWIAST